MVVQEIVCRATAEQVSTQADTRREALEYECAALDRELGRLTEALATGGELASLLAAVRARQQRRD